MPIFLVFCLIQLLMISIASDLELEGTNMVCNQNKDFECNCFPNTTTGNVTHLVHWHPQPPLCQDMMHENVTVTSLVIGNFSISAKLPHGDTYEFWLKKKLTALINVYCSREEEDCKELSFSSVNADQVVISDVTSYKNGSTLVQLVLFYQKPPANYPSDIDWVPIADMGPYPIFTLDNTIPAHFIVRIIRKNAGRFSYYLGQKRLRSVLEDVPNRPIPNREPIVKRGSPNNDGTFDWYWVYVALIILAAILCIGVCLGLLCCCVRKVRQRKEYLQKSHRETETPSCLLKSYSAPDNLRSSRSKHTTKTVTNRARGLEVENKLFRRQLNAETFASPKKKPKPEPKPKLLSVARLAFLGKRLSRRRSSNRSGAFLMTSPDKDEVGKCYHHRRRKPRAALKGLFSKSPSTPRSDSAAQTDRSEVGSAMSPITAADISYPIGRPIAFHHFKRHWSPSESLVQIDFIHAHSSDPIFKPSPEKKVNTPVCSTEKYVSPVESPPDDTSNRADAAVRSVTFRETPEVRKTDPIIICQSRTNIDYCAGLVTDCHDGEISYSAGVNDSGHQNNSGPKEYVDTNDNITLDKIIPLSAFNCRETVNYDSPFTHKQSHSPHYQIPYVQQESLRDYDYDNLAPRNVPIVEEYYSVNISDSTHSSGASLDSGENHYSAADFVNDGRFQPLRDSEQFYAIPSRQRRSGTFDTEGASQRSRNSSIISEKHPTKELQRINYNDQSEHLRIPNIASFEPESTRSMTISVSHYELGGMRDDDSCLSSIPMIDRSVADSP